MTLALLVTAATGAWADDLYVEINGTSATLKWGDAGTYPKYTVGAGFTDADFHTISDVETIETVTVDETCQNHNLTNLDALFRGWVALTTINNIENLKTEGLKSTMAMFNSCSSLQTLDLCSFKMESVEDISAMFRSCSSLTTVDLSSWNTASVKNMSRTFSDCSNLENIYVGDDWSTAAVTNSMDMFYRCTKLPNFSAGNVTHAMAKLTTDGGYLKKGGPIELTWDPVTKTATLDEMPEGNVVVNVEYYTWAGVTLSVTGQAQGGTAKLLKKLEDGSFANMTAQDLVREDNMFILMVDKEDGYDFKVPDVTFEEFTEDEYVEYYNWAKENNINVPLNSALLWVTMPHVESGNLNLEVNFQQMLTYTLLYQPATGQNPDVVACKMERSVKGTPEVSYMAMRRGASMGDGTAVWTMTMQAAYGPTKVAFVPVAAGTTEADLTTALNNAAMSGATISQSADSWTNIESAKYLIIGGNAKVVTAAFVADGNAVTTYKDFQVDEATPSEGGVQYQLAVCLTDAQGNVTTAGTVKAPAAPAAAQGVTFDGWRGYTYDGNGRLVEMVFAEDEPVSLRGNMTFNAIWNPIEVTTTFALNGGEGSISPVTKNYGETLGTIAEPTRKGFAFDKWTVMNAVTESGMRFGKGSEFDLSKGLTENLALQAQWKHVHEYTSYTISRFGDALAAYQKYNGVLHIAVCGCNDVEITEHEFNSAGKCACGYIKPGAQPVTLEPMYGQLSGSTYTNFANGFPETVKKGSEVKVDAPHNWGNLEFQTWQYSTDGGTTWNDLAAFEIVGFLIPCDMKVRAIYVNPVTTPTIELATSEGTDQTVYQGQTYKMGNILYQMNYKLPDGYKLLDAGIRMGDNSGISYYLEQTARYSLDAEAKGAAAGIGAGVAAVGVVGNVFLGGGFDIFSFTKDYSQAMFNKTEEVVYLEREENVMVQEKMSAATLAKKMYESIPINVKKYDPIYWEANAPTKGNFGSMATMPPLRFAQKNNQDHYIYGIAYMRYETPAGQMKVLYTDAIAATVNNPNGSTKKEEQPASARQMNFDFDETAAAARKAPMRVPESEQQPEQLDLSTVTAPQTQLVVFVDGKYSGQLSDTYGYNETVSLTAPDMPGKTFSYWTTNDGAVISTSADLTLTMKAHTKLRAVYNAEEKSAATAITSATRSNDGKSIVLHAISKGTIDVAGFIYSTTATGNDLTIGADGVTNVAAVLYGSMGSEMPASVIDRNNCFSLKITPGENDPENAIYHVRAYTTNGGTTTYSEVKDVKLSDLKSGLMMVANINAFDNNAETGIDALLTQLQDAGQIPAGYPVEVAAGEYATYYSDKGLALSESATDAALYTITGIGQTDGKTTATVTEIPSANAEMPFLVYNGSDETQTFLLVPTDDQINQSVAPEFVGTLEDTQIPASTTAISNYAFNGLQFVWVKNALAIGANKAYLSIQNSNARQISLVFDNEATGIQTSKFTKETNSEWYTIDGRKVTAPTKKGVYIQNGKKVVVK